MTPGEHITAGLAYASDRYRPILTIDPVDPSRRISLDCVTGQHGLCTADRCACQHRDCPHH